MSDFWETRLILKVLSGSRAYGLDHPGSDFDTRGVCIPPLEYHLGLHTFEQHEAEWLKRVRSGALTYAEVIDLAVGYESRLAEMIAHSPLPIEPAEAAVEKLLIDLQREYLFPTS